MVYSQLSSEAELLHQYEQGQRDFSQAKLPQINLSERCLSGINLAKADLWGSNLFRAALE
jgi:uncharacterized protein YjbI with pentapeptide repeats